MGDLVGWGAVGEAVAVGVAEAELVPIAMDGEGVALEPATEGVAAPSSDSGPVAVQPVRLRTIAAAIVPARICRPYAAEPGVQLASSGWPAGVWWPIHRPSRSREKSSSTTMKAPPVRAGRGSGSARSAVPASPAAMTGKAAARPSAGQARTRASGSREQPGKRAPRWNDHDRDSAFFDATSQIVGSLRLVRPTGETKGMTSRIVLIILDAVEPRKSRTSGGRLWDGRSPKKARTAFESSPMMEPV